MRSGHVALFLAITFGWSWGIWSLPVLAHRGIALPAAFGLVASGTWAAWGPLIGAVAVALARSGPRGLGTLLRPATRFRIGWRWWLVVLLTFPVLIGASLLAGAALGAEIVLSEVLRQPHILPVAFLVILLTGGPLQEEFGWRGTLLDPLQARLGALGASLAVGAVWALWHLPLFLFPNDTGPYYGRPFWGTLVTLMLISVLFTWIWNNTGRSMAAMLVFHTMFNLSHWALPVLESDTAALVLFGGQFALVVSVVAVFGAARLARPRGL